MSGLAIILSKMGFDVSGSDIVSSKITDKLQSLGIKVSLSHKKENVIGANAVVYSLAISQDNVELQEANAQNILILDRSELLGMVSKRYDKTVAISGCHGKSTTTAMVASILLENSSLPTIHIGAEFPKIQGSSLLGASDIFLTEACEYKRSFLSLKPYVSAILNIEYDHTDYYKDLDDIISAYCDFAENTVGTVITSPQIKEKLYSKENVVTCGLTSNCFYKADKISNCDGGFEFSFVKDDVCLGRIKLKVLGLHNLYNALFACAIADSLGVPFQSIERGLFEFYGISRRLELKYNKEISVYSDYAHHPTEINKLTTSLKPQNKRIVGVFQPHTYSRTINLIDDFKKCFENLDKLYIVDTYSAREKYSYIGSAEFLCEEINKENVIYVNSQELLFKLLDENIEQNDILAFIGAGDIDLICDSYVEKLENNAKTAI